MNNPSLIRWLLGLLIVSVFLANAMGLISVGFLDQLEYIAYDTRLRLNAPRGIDERIVIVDVDERSLKAEGRWPWNREKLGTLVDRLFDDYQISVLGFDMVFSEPDLDNNLHRLRAQAFDQGELELVERIDLFQSSAGHDQLFANNLKGRKVVLGYYFNNDPSQAASNGFLPDPVFRRGQFQRDWFYPQSANSFGSNLAGLHKAAPRAGFFSNSAIDSDGVFRRVTMLMEYQGELYASLSLAIASLVFDATIEPGLVRERWLPGRYPKMEWLELADRRIPVDHEVAALIPFRGREGSFPYVSATDILNNNVSNADLLKDAIVIVGTRALGQVDHRPTPVQEVYPGVEIQANLISGILDGVFLHQPAYVIGLETAIVLLSGLLMMALMPRLSAGRAAMFSTLLILTLMFVNLLLWRVANLVVPLAASCVMMIALYMLNTSFGFFFEARALRRLGNLFGQYVPPELVKEMSEDPAVFGLEGERREMTVMFADIRGFTHIAETLDPKELSRILNEFLTWFTDIAHRHRGTIDKYMGDGVMAFWGAPMSDSFHARHAVEAGQHLIASLPALRVVFEQRNWPLLRIGIGINTGVMNVGNMGSDFRMAYTVIGDAVNISARLEDITKDYGVDVLVGEKTRLAVPEYMFREVDKVQLKGRDRAVIIYEPLGRPEQVNDELRNELSLYRQALGYYRQQNWDLAELQFLGLSRSHPTRGLYRAYIERIKHFREAPPDGNWDGTFAFDQRVVYRSDEDLES